MGRSAVRLSFAATSWAVSLVFSFDAAAQNVTTVSAPHEVTVNAVGVRSVSTMPESRIAVPVGVGADLGSGEQKGVAPTLGFQLWKTDNYFVGAFFTIAGTDTTVSEGYGAFVLNPPRTGRSFHLAGNYMFNRSDQAREVLFGVGGRWSATSASFEVTPAGGTTVKVGGFGMVAAVTGQIMSRTHYVGLGVGEERQEFQLGVELGPTWHLLGGNLSENDTLREQLLGTANSAFAGFETTFFVRLNSVQPFARFTSFGRPDGVVIPGLTGRQLIWGVNVASSLFNSKAE